MTTRKSKKKVLDITKGYEVEVEVDEDGARTVREPFPTFEVELNIPEKPGKPDGADGKTLAAHRMFEMLEKAKQDVMPNFSPLDLNIAKGNVMEDPFAYMDSRSVDEVINMEYPGLLRDRDQSQILIAILKELVRARRAHD